MDERQQKQVNEAAEKFADAIKESYQALANRSVSAQELNAQLTQEFFNAVINNLRSQAEDNREMIRELVDQQQRQQEAAQSLAQESTKAYMEFLDSMFFFYRRSVEEAERTTEASMEEIGRAAGASPKAPAESRAGGDLPLEDYDSMNVREVSSKLGELSVEEIRQLRDYEASNKNRRTLISRLDARIEAGSS